MAQQLQGSGEVVEMLALIDAEPAHWELRLAHRFLGALGVVIPSIAERRFNWFTRFRHFAGLFRRGMRQIPERRSQAWTFLKSFISKRLRLEQIFQRTRVTLHSLSPARFRDLGAAVVGAVYLGGGGVRAAQVPQ